MKIVDLGKLTGDVLLFGGCYSNLQATQALLLRAKTLNIPNTNLICTGDVVGYCADPSDTVALLREAGVSIIAGNVEKQLAEGADDCGCGFEEGSVCDRLSAGWYPYAFENTPFSMREWMVDLPDLIIFWNRGKRYVVVHGGFSYVSKFIWPTSPDAEFQREIDLITEKVGMIDGVVSGHSGLAFERDISGTMWLNAGVIGMPPHDGRKETRFAVLGDQGPVIQRLEYDVKAARNAMVDAGLTHGYEKSLVQGVWPSEDVLPNDLRRS